MTTSPLDDAIAALTALGLTPFIVFIASLGVAAYLWKRFRR
jgi:hypothetical protein